MKTRAWLIVPNEPATIPYATTDEPSDRVRALAQIFGLGSDADGAVELALSQWKARNEKLIQGKEP